MPWHGPDERSDYPTLGWEVLDWMEDYLVVPDGPLAGEPLVLTQEQSLFVLRFYEVDQRTGKRKIRRGVYSRPKGSGKSPLLAGLSLVEALAPVVFDGWDAAGEPVGRTWESLGFKPKVQIVAVSEDQTANTWDPLLDMCAGPVAEAYDIEPLQTFVNVPRGVIEYVSSSATSREGFRPVFAVMDQTESWLRSNGGHKLAAAIRRNLTKTGGSSIETPNAFRPGEESVAELSWKAYDLQKSGRTKGDKGILVDHREMPADTDIADRRSLLKGLAFAYGCSAHRPRSGCAIHGKDCPPGWVDLNRVLADFWDPATEPGDARMYYGNQITSASDSFVEAWQWKACHVPGRRLKRGDTVTLGFDGSKHRKRGVTDATALVATRLEDGHSQVIASWEQPDGPAGADWEVPPLEVDAAVREAFREYRVVGFYADPAKWETYVASWEAEFGAKLKVKVTAKHPIEWWINQGRSIEVCKMIAELETAIVERQISHDLGLVLTQHVLHAKRDPHRSGLWIRKETPDSSNKIDAAWALALSVRARKDAIAAGVKAGPTRAPRRLR